MKDKRVYDFPCNKWLSGQEEDKKTYRVLPVTNDRAFIESKPNDRAFIENKTIMIGPL